MNDAHLHMVVNHFPIIGTILATGVLLISIFLNNSAYRRVAYGLFIVAAIFAAISMGTGEGAEEMVEDMPSIGDNIIHNHEEWAEKLAIVLYLLGIVSIAGLFAEIKKNSKAKLVAIIALIISFIGIYLAKETGTSGGEVRHTEIRKDAVNTNNSNESSESEHEED